MNIFAPITELGHKTFGVPAKHINKKTFVETEVNIVKKSPTEIQNFSYGGESVIEKMLVNVLVSELAEIKNNDTFIIDGVAYCVVGDSEIDTQRLLHKVRLNEI